MRKLIDAIMLAVLVFLASHPKPVEKAYVIAVNTLCEDYPHDLVCNELKYIALP